MKKALPLVLGLLMAGVGLLWTLQGLGFLAQDGVEEPFFAIVGPLVAGLGVALAIVAVRGVR